MAKAGRCLVKLPRFLRTLSLQMGTHKVPLMKGKGDESLGARTSKDLSPVEGRNLLGGPAGQVFPSGPRKPESHLLMYHNVLEKAVPCLWAS